MRDEKNIRMLENKISDIDLQLQMIKDKKVQKKKIRKLEMIKLKFQIQLEELQYV
jgi:hypothetical protein